MCDHWSSRCSSATVRVSSDGDDEVLCDHSLFRFVRTKQVWCARREALVRMEERGKAGGEGSVEEKYEQWKSLIPILYDWFSSHNLVWPSLSCRWGPLIKQAIYKNKQRLYLSEQTDGSFPNTLVIANCEVVLYDS